jgi:hypothetical protein
MNAEVRRLSSAFERLTRVYPADFRRLFGEDMAHHFPLETAMSLVARAGGDPSALADPLRSWPSLSSPTSPFRNHGGASERGFR